MTKETKKINSTIKIIEKEIGKEEKEEKIEEIIKLDLILNEMKFCFESLKEGKEIKKNLNLIEIEFNLLEGTNATTTTVRNDDNEDDIDINNSISTVTDDRNHKIDEKDIIGSNSINDENKNKLNKNEDKNKLNKNIEKIIYLISLISEIIKKYEKTIFKEESKKLNEFENKLIENLKKIFILNFKKRNINFLKKYLKLLSFERIKILFEFYLNERINEKIKNFNEIYKEITILLKQEIPLYIQIFKENDLELKLNPQDLILKFSLKKFNFFEILKNEFTTNEIIFHFEDAKIFSEKHLKFKKLILEPYNQIRKIYPKIEKEFLFKFLNQLSLSNSKIFNNFETINDSNESVSGKKWKI